LLFRKAVVADIPALFEVRMAVTENVLSDPSKVTPEIFADYLSASGKGWLCEDEGRAIGFSVASLGDASIWALFVRPGYEGRGVGTRLLELATGWLFDAGAPRVILSTEAGTRADRFYQRCGWARGEVRPDGEVGFRLERPPRL
jgi:GNAT superfamily N-acetyltransferase